MKNSINLRLWGRYALFTDPITRIGGEKCTYQIPTYEAIKGVLKSVYWKPTLVWHIDKVRVINPLRTQNKGVKPAVWNGGNSLAIYTYLHMVEYQVEAHFEWNLHRPELEIDRIDGKHYAIAKRSLDRGGRQDIFLGVRDCQGYVEPTEFGLGDGHYDDQDYELGFGMMFHGFDYPDETGKDEMQARFFRPVMTRGIIEFPRPEECELRRFIRPMEAKKFITGENLLSVKEEEGV